MAEKYTKEQLNSLDKSFIIQMFLNQQDQLERMANDLSDMNTKMQQVLEQLAFSQPGSFGRFSGKDG